MLTKNISRQSEPSAAEIEIDLVRLLGELINHRWMIISITVLFTSFALGYAVFSTPIYRADALIQIEQKQGKSILSSLSAVIPGNAPESAPEIQLLQSRMILGKTIDDLNLRNIVAQDYFPLFGRGWARLRGEVSGQITIDWMTIPLLHGQAQCLTLIVGEDGHYQLQGVNIEAEGVVGQLLDKNGISLKISGIQARPGTKFHLLQQTKQEAISDLLTHFTVSERSKDSGMLGLTITGEDPQLLVRIINSIAHNYLQQNIARQAAQDLKSLEFLQRQLPQVRRELDEAENKLNNYRKQRDSVDLNLEAKSVLEQIVSVDNQLNELAFRKAEIAQLYKKDHPTYKALMDKRHTLEQEKARLNKRVSAMPSTQQEVLRLSRDVQSGHTVYLQLLNRQQELKISQSSAIGNVRIIDSAMTHPKPIEPKKALIVIMGITLGLGFSIGLVLALTLLRRGIKSPEQLEELGIQVYATVPVSRWLEKKTILRSRNIFSNSFHHRTQNVPFLPVEKPDDLSVEAIRGLRTSLHFAMLESSNNILMISGATPNCGKTFVSSTLAAVVAQSEQKVLFIDADMRRGYVHDLLGIKNECGLSDVLSGKAMMDDVLQTASKVGFDVITRGEVPANPAELLMHDRFRELMVLASEHYDLVIVDTPPMLAVTDAAIIGRSAGTSLVVARFGVNTLKEMIVSIQRLKHGGVNIRGAILNGIISSTNNKYLYGHYY